MSETDQRMAARGERIAKVLARAGVCSRRDAERRIAGRRVSVNGVALDSPAVKVAAQDRIEVDGVPIAGAEATRLWRYHKPAGLLTTHKDPQGRPTVFDALPRALPRVISVGRLDLNSEGLLLLTNDGDLARRLEHPDAGWTRRYRARVQGEADDSRLRALAGGVNVDGVRYRPIEVRIDRVQGANTWLTATLTEGKNREIRRVMEFIGYRVNRLIRVSYGPFHIGRLEAGEVEEVPSPILRRRLADLKGEASEPPLRLARNTAGWAKPKPRKPRPGSKKRPRNKAASNTAGAGKGAKAAHVSKAPRPNGSARLGTLQGGRRNIRP